MIFGGMGAYHDDINIFYDAGRSGSGLAELSSSPAMFQTLSLFLESLWLFTNGTPFTVLDTSSQNVIERAH